MGGGSGSPLSLANPTVKPIHLTSIGGAEKLFAWSCTSAELGATDGNNGWTEVTQRDGHFGGSAGVDSWNATVSHQLLSGGVGAHRRRGRW